MVDNKKIAELMIVLKQRFEDNKQHFKDLTWSEIENRLQQDKEKIISLLWMEETGGEPSVLSYNLEDNQIEFCDFSVESPSGRRGLCFDPQALESRSKNKPMGSAVALCIENNVKLLDQQQYEKLQTFGEFDLKTSSWIQTPQSIRSLGGALFMDRRYNTVFVYHNGAESYYSARGFRVSIIV